MSENTEVLTAVRAARDNIRRVVDASLEAGRRLTDGGRAIDEHQPHTERLAYLATEALAVDAIVDYAERANGHDPLAQESAAVFTAMVGSRVRAEAEKRRDAFGVEPALLDDTIDSPEFRGFVRCGMTDDRIDAIGRKVLEARGVPDSWLEAEEHRMTREMVRDFARSEVAPLAQEIHINDDLVPDSIINKMAELGFFGLAIPEQFGGQGMGNEAMILTTEELSVASLAAAGSLITRPEILTKALLAGGSEDQKQAWLPRIAAGEIMAAISVTEPDTGSDVASVKVRAEKGEQDGKPGYFISGAKAWCTFAGRANVIAMLTRDRKSVV